MPERPYLFLELTNSICSQCLRKVEAKIVERDGSVFMHKRCPDHGRERVLLSTDVDYYKRCRTTLKAGQLPLRFQTETRYGCPYDCGLCPDHEQHSCVTLIEVTDRCNLTCPVCYASSAPNAGSHRSLEQIEFMLDCAVMSEGEPDVVQISGGEPTIHPEFFAILDAAKKRPIKHLMVNTNGVRIAESEEFARRLASYRPGFEIYLQFDSLQKEPIESLRGGDLREVRRRALERLNEHNVSTTLVVTLKKGRNDDEIGEIIEFALGQPCVRGVTFQPIQAAGRLEGFDPARDRLTLGEVRRQIIRQTDLFQAEDVVPVPCHPDCIAMAYALKRNGTAMPLTRLVDPQALLADARNTIVYEKTAGLFSSGHSPDSSADSLRQLLCCLPQVEAPGALGYDNIFRVLIVQFLDAYNFDVRSVKKTCVHIVHPDGRIIPFDTFNLFYREPEQVARLERLRALEVR